MPDSRGSIRDWWPHRLFRMMLDHRLRTMVDNPARPAVALQVPRRLHAAGRVAEGLAAVRGDMRRCRHRDDLADDFCLGRCRWDCRDPWPKVPPGLTLRLYLVVPANFSVGARCCGTIRWVGCSTGMALGCALQLQRRQRVGAARIFVVEGLVGQRRVHQHRLMPRGRLQEMAEQDADAVATGDRAGTFWMNSW